MNVLYFYLVLLAHPYLAMWWRSFEQAGRKPWEALVPGYNYFVVFKLGAQKPFWSLLLIFPGVHIVMWAVANVSYIRRFGYFTLLDTVQGIFFPYIIMAKIANSNDPILPETNWANSREVANREWGDHLALFLSLPIIGHAIALTFAAVSRPKPGKKTKVKEWGDSIWFALVAALIIRTYVFEPFKIPTGSMEKTLLVGDFLFVNKIAYGPKVPVTPFSYPLVHNTVPWIDVKSYLAIETSGYTRIWGYSEVQPYDVVVFNYPSGDTAIYDPRMPTGLMGHNYHDYVNDEALQLWKEQSNKFNQYQLALSKFPRPQQGVEQTQEQIDAINAKDSELYNQALGDFIANIEYWKNKARAYIASGKTHVNTANGMEIVQHYGIITRPVDKRENYIKRCVGVPGDYLELKNSILYRNGKRARVFSQQLLRYNVTGFGIMDYSQLLDRYDIDEKQGHYYPQARMDNGETGSIIFANLKTVRKLREDYSDLNFKLIRNEQYSDKKGYVPTNAERLENLEYFPNDLNVNNRVTDFTKFWVPKKGVTITLTKENIPYYRRIITAYEGHTLKENKDGTFLIDGKKTNKYKFAMNYYWMMGDNRNNSIDCRMWGFVPEDHIVGKASMIWLSSGADGFRWDRMFKGIK